MLKKMYVLLATASAIAANAYGGDLPLSYDRENTGAEFEDPVLPTVNQLPTISKLPNPFEWSDRSGQVTDFCEWSKRRNEIKREIEHYEIGEKPTFDNLTASLTGNTLTVKVTNKGNTLTLTSKLVIPQGNGPHPIVIGMDGNTGCLSSSYFSKCIQVPFTHSQIAEYSSGFGGGSRSQNDPFYKLFPGTFNTKADYCAWSWGISRLIDGLEQVKDQLNADLTRLAVTGCSYAGKMALFAGAFDERVALTIAQESGGGGINSWRVCEKIGSSVEGISNTNYEWFLQSFKTNFNGKTSKIPYDHHELIAMIAPRAFLAFGNPPYEWLGDESGYISLRAAEEVWTAMGIEDRFGYVIEGGHNHCQASSSQNQAAQKFINKFLYGNTSENTNIRTSTISPEYQSWKSDWAGHKLTFGDCADISSVDDSTNTETYWLEAETETCGKVGSDFEIGQDKNASGGKYVEVKAGLNSVENAPAASGQIRLPFSVNRDTTYHFHFRLNCKDYNDDSYWVKIDDGDFEMQNGMETQGDWQWFELAKQDLAAGDHMLTIAYREDGAKLDKICITSRGKAPKGLGEEQNYCGELSETNNITYDAHYALASVQPNPVTGGEAEVCFSLAKREQVSLTLINTLGEKVLDVANGTYEAGSHQLTVRTAELPKGIYNLVLRTEGYSASRKVIVH